MPYAFTTLAATRFSAIRNLLMIGDLAVHDSGSAGTPTFQLGEEAPPSFLIEAGTGCRVTIQL